MIETTLTLIKKEIAPCKDIVFLWFESKEIFTFREGQFAMLSSPDCKDKKGDIIKKAYRIATTNKELQEKSQIGFIVKRTSDHGMSHFLVNTIKEGEAITMNGPTGNLIDDGRYKNYLLISNGSGLGPIYAHYIHLIQKTKDFEKIAMIFGERYQSHLLKSVESNLQIQTNNIKNIVFLSKEKKLQSEYHQGHVQNGIDKALNFLDTKDIKIIICGKPAMVNECKNILLEKGISESQIIIEKY